MLGAQRQLDVLANNLANVSTTGYRRDSMAFAKTLEAALISEGGRGTPIGTMSFSAAIERPYTIFSAGAITATGNPLDVAIQEEDGMFAVQGKDGTRYTRNGSFTTTSDGLLATKDGEPVLDPDGLPIQIPHGKVVIDEDGTVNVDDRKVGKIGVFKGTFFKEGDGLFASSNAELTENPRLRWQALEGSNVSAVESMVDMIDLQRRFDLAQRSILQQDELTQKLIQSLNQS